MNLRTDPDNDRVLARVLASPPYLPPAGLGQGPPQRWVVYLEPLPADPQWSRPRLLGAHTVDSQGQLVQVVRDHVLCALREVSSRIPLGLTGRPDLVAAAATAGDTLQKAVLWVANPTHRVANHGEVGLIRVPVPPVGTLMFRRVAPGLA